MSGQFRELRMRHPPSISAADRLDRDMYLVLEDFSNGAAWRDEDVAHELEQRVAEGHEVTEPVREFIERFTGRPIGVQLLLPLREF